MIYMNKADLTFSYANFICIWPNTLNFALKIFKTVCAHYGLMSIKLRLKMFSVQIILELEADINKIMAKSSCLRYFCEFVNSNCLFLSPRKLYIYTFFEPSLVLACLFFLWRRFLSNRDLSFISHKKLAPIHKKLGKIRIISKLLRIIP